MKKSLLIIFLTFFAKVNGQTYVKIPDANFVTYLQALVPSAMNIDSLNTSSTLVTTSTQTINVKGKNIADLTGVQYFTSLINLNCSSNSLTSLPPLPNTLKYIYCGNNALASLPALPTSLQELFCDTNQLSILPTLPSALAYLSCGFNQLTSIPTLPTSFLSLYCCKNNITSLPTLPSSIYYLNCTVNSLSSLPPSLPNSLLYLYLGDNNISSLPPLPNQLKYFWCDYNNLTSIPTLPNTLQYFMCYNNSITILPALPNSLIAFNCSNNQISCFPWIPSNISTLGIDPNPYNCLPNYISAMNSYDLSFPICTVGNTNGCLTDIEQVAFNNITTIYPNPTNGQFIIETNATYKQTVQLFDLNGKLVLSKNISGTAEIDASMFDNGIYNLTIKNSLEVVNRKLVIAR